MTQPLPVNYACIGNVGYGTAFDPPTPLASSPCGPRPGRFCRPLPAPPFLSTSPRFRPRQFGPTRSSGVSGFSGNFRKPPVVNLAYVGSRGTHLTVERQLNQLRPLPVKRESLRSERTPDHRGLHRASPRLPSREYPGDGTVPFLLQNGTLVTPQNPAYMYLQAACTNPNIPNVNSLPGRPYPGLGRVLSLQNVANSTYHAFQGTLRHTSGPLTAGLSYSYSHSIDDASDRSDPVLANSYDLRENQASSSFDERHLLNISYVYRLPLKDFLGASSTGPTNDRRTRPRPKQIVVPHWGMLLLDGWELSGVTLVSVGHTVHGDQQRRQHRHFPDRQRRGFQRARHRGLISRRYEGVARALQQLPELWAAHRQSFAVCGSTRAHLRGRGPELPE